ncbi:MAG: hypothetical protein O7I93_17625, partial [Gemmatimonadetes bacterium]|nr:hypothetical protein [Gemmatimonadota bacterium]
MALYSLRFAIVSSSEISTEDHLAALFGLAHREHLHPGQRVGHGAHIPVDLFGIAEHVGCADDVPQDLQWGGDRGGRRQVV